MNNTDWGLRTMLSLSFVLIFALFIVVIIVNSKLPILKPTSNNKYNATYISYEIMLREAAEKYGNKKEVVTYPELKNKGYIEELIDPATNQECKGYVIIKEDNYTSYLKCGLSYKTSRYNFMNE